MVGEEFGAMNERGALDGPPKGYFVVVPARDEYQEDIDLARMVATALRGWRKVLAAALAGALIAATVSIFLPSVYRAQVLVAPVQQSGTGALGALQSQVGGIAAIAGIELGGAADTRKESFARLASSGFARDFIVTRQLLPALFRERWDAAAGQWQAGEKVPTVEDGVRRFTRDVRAVNEDRKTGLVTLTVDWYDPVLAEQWANGLIDLANERLRAEAVEDSRQRIDFLNGELRKTDVLELRQAIYRLVESQLNNAMLASAQEEFAFRVIDAAVVPDRRIRPKRTVLTIVGGLLGATIGLVWVFGPGWIRTVRAHAKREIDTRIN